MVLNNIKSTKGRGFTIVELLVVIVVIGILAAITIVSYTGITAKANAAKAQSNASSVQSVADTYAVDPANAGYPTQAQLVAYSGYTKIPTGVTVSLGALNALPGLNPTTTILYLHKADLKGACVGWWDSSAATPAMAYIYLGTATSGSLNIATPTCN